ncbi:MAG: LacI family DNA-binding transcriptional regulator [Thermaceae bacterium]|nr:LacI family DNA-binding transcriptional regulator [Thermaceae bacterium]
MMEKRRVTSQEVAKRAGVSRTTVSFVLNDVPGSNISAETRRRVLRAAEELGYVPNAAARSLVSGQTLTIGLIISHAEHLQVDAFIPQLLYSISYTSHQHGYRVLLETVEDVSKPDAYLELVRGQRIDGLMVLNMRSDDSQLPELIRRNFPVVLLGFREWPGLKSKTFSVETDGTEAGSRATTHLIALGHTRIAHITFSPENYYATQDRRRGYRKALEAAGLNYDPALVKLGNYSAASGYEAMKELLQRKPYPTALFAGNDTIALGAMAAIHQHGLRIPEDIAVVGYDDIPTAPYMVPPLTSVQVAPLQQGRIAVEMLSGLMSGKPPAQNHIRLETPLVIRESCGAKLEAKTASKPLQR